MSRIIDHIVYCVPDLDQAVAELQSKLGVRPAIGGKHISNGTKNALLNIGNGCYLELLAKDGENEDFNGDRWMGIDMITKPKITRWSLKTSDLNRDCDILKKYNPNMGIIFEGSRNTNDDAILQWRMSLPLAFPEVELVPFITDWTESDYHPTDRLPQLCDLEEIQFFHPNTERISVLFDKLEVKAKINISKETRIQIRLTSPTGSLVLF